MRVTPDINRHPRNQSLLAQASFSGGGFEVRNPSTGALLAVLPDTGGKETRDAIERSAAIQPVWAGFPAKDRSATMRRWHDLVIVHLDDRINTGRMSFESAPFGRLKQPGIGREGSRYGMEDYLDMKYLCMGNI